MIQYANNSLVRHHTPHVTAKLSLVARTQVFSPALTWLAGAPQDFLALDKSISPELSSLYNNLIQFPLIGQAQVITYNIPELSPSDPHMVCVHQRRRF